MYENKIDYICRFTLLWNKYFVINCNYIPWLPFNPDSQNIPMKNASNKILMFSKNIQMIVFSCSEYSLGTIHVI